MPFLMSDVAAGSQAALQLQQNMAAAPNVQQVEANKMQEAQLKLQQDQANVERSKLANLITDSGFKASQESKVALQKLASSPEYQAADDVKRLQMMAAKQFESGDVENGAKTLTASELYQSRNLANTQKQLDLNSQQVTNAYAVASALKSPEQINGFFKDLETQKPEQYKILVDQIGAERFAKLTPEEKVEVTKFLMLNARGQLATQLKSIETDKAKLQTESNERIARIRADALIEARMISHSGGFDKEERLGWSSYERADQAIDRFSEKSLAALDEKVKETDAARTKSIPWYSREPSDAANTAYIKAVKEKNEFEQKLIKRKLDLAVSAPEFNGKKVIVEELQRQLASYVSPEDDKTKAAPTRGKPTPAATSAQGAAPPEALAMLAKDPSEKNKAFFKETFGYLPEEAAKPVAPVATAAVATPTPTSSAPTVELELRELDKTMPNKAAAFKGTMTEYLKDPANVEYEMKRKKAIEEIEKKYLDPRSAAARKSVYGR